MPAVRTRVALALFCLAAVALAGAWWALRPRAFTLAADANRNVLLVTIDTLRADALGAYGGGAATPNLDRLAAGGARFDFAHAHAVVTLPSHASLLSGTYPYQHGIRDNTGYRFNASQPTIATLLKAHGFATGAFIGGFPLDRRFGLGAGFDTYDDRLQAASAADSGERERRADAVIASASQWIDAQAGRWFAWVHLYDPHAVYAAPQAFADRYPGSPYLGEVAWTDHALGPLFALMAAQPRDTLIVVTSDHGEGLDDHGELTHGVFAYESVLRVPMIVAEARAGGGAPGNGVVIETPARHVDVLPTLLEAVGVAVPDNARLAGASLAGVIADGGGGARPSYFEAMTSTVTRGWAPLRGVIEGGHKYIDLPIPELYDLETDPRETVNLAARDAARVQVMVNLLEGFDVAPPSQARAETPETLERLRSLGYIGGGTAGVRERYTEADDPKRLIELEQMMHQAAEAQRRGDTDAAITLYRRVIDRRSDMEDAYRRLALAYWRQGRAADAIATLEQALQSGVTQSEVRIKLGQYLAEAGDPARAIALLEHTAGDDPDALIALGNAYALAGRHRDAMRTFERLLTRNPSHALAHENAGAMSIRLGDYAAAERSLRRAVALDPALAGAHTALGVVLSATGRRTEAIDAWKRAVEIDGAELNALFNLAVNLASAGRDEEARTHAQRFLALAPPSRAADAAAMRRVAGRDR